MAKPIDRMLSVRQVRQEYLSGLGLRAIYNAIHRGELRASRCGKKILIRESDVRRFIDALPEIEPYKNR